jgi:hypothetical protein
MENKTPTNTQWHIDINPDKDKKLCGNCIHFDLWGVSTGHCVKKGKTKSSWGWCRNDFEKKEK